MTEAERMSDSEFSTKAAPGEETAPAGGAPPKGPHVFVGLTTMDSRLDKVDMTVRSLLDQDYADHSVILHLSRKGYLLDKGVRHLPPALEALERSEPRFAIRWVPNMGPYRKLLPLLAALGTQPAFVATADDDTIYPADWLSALMRLHRHYRCVIANRAHPMQVLDGRLTPYRTWMRASILRNPDLLLLPTGKDGILYHTAHFSQSVLDYQTARRIAPTADDIWFRWHTAMANVPVYCVATDYRKETLASTDARPISLYHHFNRDGGNDEVIGRVDEWARSQRNFDIIAANSGGGNYRMGG